MIIRRSSYHLLAAVLGLSFALGLGFSFCPAGSMASSEASGEERSHCADTHENGLGACSHALLSVGDSGPCTSLGTVSCVEEAIPSIELQRWLDGSSGTASTVDNTPESHRPTLSSLRRERSEVAPASLIALHLLNSVWLN